MIFNNHSDLVGKHSLLSPSKYHWINYDEDRTRNYVLNLEALKHGTELHEFAATCIRLGQKLPRSRKTLNAYVNDAIGYRMTPEQVLYFSRNCFGTADSISVRDNLLRIHDLKTGTVPAHMEQLWIYSALYCLEYKEDPYKIDIELRIYQNDEIIIENPDADRIAATMDKIISSDKIANEVRKGEFI